MYDSGTWEVLITADNGMNDAARISSIVPSMYLLVWCVQGNMIHVQIRSPDDGAKEAGSCRAQHVCPWCIRNGTWADESV